MVDYQSDAIYEIKKLEVEYLTIPETGQSFQATIYVPIPKPGETSALFPVLLDVHGGAWQGGSRFDGEYMDKSLAASGVLVAAVDFRIAPKDPYPAQVQDVNYALRWWKATSPNYGGDPTTLGALGLSSGGHTLMLNVLKPSNSIYSKHSSDSDYDASVAYCIGSSAVLDSHARYLYAKKIGRTNLIEGSLGYFRDEETMKEGNPQLLLERGEQESLPPTLLIHGAADAAVPNLIPEKYALTYSNAGGTIELRMFEGMHHNFAREPLPESHQAIKMIKDFISEHIN